MKTAATSFIPSNLQAAIVRNPLIVSPDATIREAIALMSQIHIRGGSPQTRDPSLDELQDAVRSSCVLVVENEQLLGILTERDIVRLSDRQPSLDNLIVRGEMASPVVSLRESDFTDIFSAANLLQQQIHPVPLLDDQDRVVGLLTHESLWQLRLQGEYTAEFDRQVEQRVEQRTAEIKAEATRDQRTAADQQAQAELTKRERIEATLRKSEQRYATLTEIAPVGIFQTDAEGHCLYVNERWCQIAGLTPDEAAGFGWANSIHPDDRELVSTEWYAATQANHPFRLEYRFQNAAGQIIWVFGQAAAERAATGEIVGYVGTITDISDRKQAETERLQTEKLRIELKLLENILDVILSGYWDWDLQTNQEYLSPGFKRMFGYAEDELPNSPETWQRLIFPEDLPGVLACFDRHIQSHGEVPYYNEVRYRHKDGSTVWVLCSGQVIEWDEAGHALRMIGCHMNITQRKQAEEQLQQTKEEIERFFDVALDLLCIADTEGHFRRLNRAWETTLGYSIEELEGKEFLDFVHPEDIASTLEAIAILSNQETLQAFVNRYRCQDGTYRYIEWYCRPYSNLIYCAARDITNRKQVEAQLQNLSDRLTLAVESGAIAIWDWNVTDNILTWDDRMYELYGAMPNQFTSVYDAWASRLHPDDRPHAEAAIQKALAGEKDYDPEFRVVHADGTIHFIKAYALVQRNAQDEPQSMVGINFDITDCKQAETKLLQTTAQLEASNRELEAFAYSVSHDLRSPLRAIDGFSKALLEDYGDQFDEEGKDYFDRIRHNVNRMGMLIDDLLRLSRVSRSEMQHSVVDLSALVQEQMDELQALEPERQVTWVVVPRAIVSADATLMRVVISNLLQNAWKFTSHHATARIEFGVMPKEAHPTYFVRDDGAGFDMVYANMLFGVFQRLHNTHEFPGTGIGLATVQRAIHRHGGQVWAEGAVEQGATIYFTVPQTPMQTPIQTPIQPGA